MHLTELQTMVKASGSRTRSQLKRHSQAAHTHDTKAGCRTGWVVAGLLGIALGILLWSPPDRLIDRLAGFRPGCIYRARLHAPIVALTIDDGPDPVSTPLILAELRRHDAHATFFLISSRVAGREQLVRELVAEGHELGNHLTRDETSIRLLPPAFEEALVEAHQALAAYGPVRWMRPASGWYSRTMIDIIQRHQYRCALGSIYPLDAALPWPWFSAHYIRQNARPGAILILHDGGARGLRTARVLRTVLPALRAKGYRIVTLSELVGAA
jgi:peptidoglycan/xylan/chitin deacetylase (PgdA/CDA1 family)